MLEYERSFHVNMKELIKNISIQDSLISIVIPLYNREELVKETLDSVLAQTYPNWECIIVDDISTDNSLETIREYAQTDSRFKFFQRQREPKGAPTCRNIGLKNVKGEYVIFLDSDDLLLPCCLENRIKHFKINPEIDIVISLQMRKENGEDTFYVNLPSSVHPLIRFFSLYPNNDIPWLNNSLLIKRSFLSDNNIEWDESVKLHQDIQFNIALLVNSPNYEWSNHDYDSYWVYNDKVENIGRNNHDNIERIRKLNEIYWKSLNNPRINKDLNVQLKNQFYAHIISVSVELAMNKEIQYNNYLSVVNHSSDLPWFDRILLRLLGKLYRLPRRIQYHVFLSEKIKKYLSEKYQPVIKEGFFLTMSKLNSF